MLYIKQFALTSFNAAVYHTYYAYVMHSCIEIYKYNRKFSPLDPIHIKILQQQLLLPDPL